MQRKETPVLLLTGYLGSGKTTLVNRILANKRGLKFAVIVNDIGEVNIDADLIQKGGVVGKKDESLVALQNGCICCTLKMDLVEQLSEIMKMKRFDYIVIEASGICEPEPIARTICSIPQMEEQYTRDGVARLDCIVTVVDALRMQSEFACGDQLIRSNFDDEDIESLLIQQIEFCNMVLINKASEVSAEELERIKQIINHLQPGVRVMSCDYADINLEEILDTQLFNYENVSASAGWVREIEHPHEENEEEGEADEYGIGTFVYYSRKAFDANKFDHYVATRWPANIIRAKGICYFKNNRDMSYLFEQAGVQKNLTEAGLWYAAAPKEELMQLMIQEPGLMRDWDKQYGDRMEKIVFIGQHLDKEQLTRDLDACLE